MGKKSAKSGHSVAPATLTDKDADRFEAAAKKYATANTTTQTAARSKLVELGIHTKDGRLTKHYGG